MFPAYSNKTYRKPSSELNPIIFPNGARWPSSLTFALRHQFDLQFFYDGIVQPVVFGNSWRLIVACFAMEMQA